LSLLRPWALGLLLPILFGLWAQRRRQGGARAVLLVRGAGLALLAIALARPLLRTGGAAPVRVAILAPGVDPGFVQRTLEAVPAAEELRLVAADAPPRELPPLPRRPRGFVLPERPADRVADLEAAMDLAQALVPEDREGALLWLAGPERSLGLPAAAGARARARGIPIDVVPAAARPGVPALRLRGLPVQARAAATVEVSVEVTGFARDLVAMIHIELGGESVRASLEPGQVPLLLPLPAEPGRHEGLLELRGPDGALLLPSRPLAVQVAAPPRILIASESPGAEEVLARLLGPGFQVRAVSPSELSADSGFAGFAACILEDLPGAAFSGEALEALESEVRRGLALLLLGGRRAFGPGGYAGTALDRLSPLRSIQREERRDPSATLVIIIDTSGSMMGQRIDLAKEVARLALQRLQLHDRVGIVEFHGAKRWAAPIQPAANAVEIQRALNRLSAGGGTVIFPALEEAYYGLLNVRTRTRHVLVITDGGVEEGDFEGLVRRMVEHGMTVSSVLVGASSGHSEFLVSLAQWGRGRFYHCPDRFQLPEVRVKQPETSLLPPWRDEETALRAGPGSQAHLEWPRVPLQGRLEAEALPTAEVLVETAAGEPLLARWRYGEGAVLAFASDLGGPWGGALVGDPELARALTALMREASAARGEGVRIEGTVDGDLLLVRVFDPEGARRLVLEVRDGARMRWVRRLGPRATEHPLEAWAELLRPLAPGPLEVLVRDEEGRILAEGAGIVPRPEEEAGRPFGEEALWELAWMTGGRVDGSLSPLRARGRVFRELWPLCAGLALLLLVGQVALRRLPLILAGLLLAVPASAQDPTLLPAEEEVLSRLLAAGDGEALESLLAGVRARRGDAAPLMGALQERLQAAPGAAPAAMLARVLAAEGEIAEARSVLAPWLAGEPPDPALLGFAAELAELAGAETEALELLVRAEAAGGVRGPALRIRQALLLADTGQEDEALRAFARAAEAAEPGSRLEIALLTLLVTGRSPGAPELAPELVPEPDGDRACKLHLLSAHLAARAGDHERAACELGLALVRATRERERRFIEERMAALARARGGLAALADRWLAEAASAPARDPALVAVLRELRRPDEALRLLESRGEDAGTAGRAEEDLQREIIGLALECGRGDEVVARYRSRLDRDPSRLGTRRSLALSLLLSGEREAAEEVFRERLAAASPREVLRLAEAALDLGLDSTAEHCAGTIPLDSPSRPAAELFLVRVLERRGESEAAVARLQAIERDLRLDPPLQLALAEAYERLRQDADALRVLAAAAASSGAEDLRIREAWLHERRGERDRALEIWIELWRASEVPARVRQAEERILALGVRSGRLAELAIALEAELDAGRGTMRDLNLLIAAYARARDPIAAIELLRRHGPRVGASESEELERTALVLEAGDDYTEAGSVLRRLLEREPERRLEIWQRLALAAWERGKGREVRAILDEIARIAPGDPGALEFQAGCLALIELPEEAARCYARVAAAHPERSEAVLLMGNSLAAAGRRDAALCRFGSLAFHAAREDLFTIAVDGLLNLRAPPQLLRAASRRVLERFVREPEKGFLAELAQDLCGELRDRRRGEEAMLLHVLVAGERRSTVLRVLMDTAREEGRSLDLIAHGRSLLALGEEVPPEVFLGLGESLVQAGDLAGAERAFSRLRAEHDFVAMQRRIAGIYAEAGHVLDAERLLRQALIIRPHDVELLRDVARAAELAGHTDRAARDAARALDLLFEASPRRVEEREGRRSARSVITTGGAVRITASSGPSGRGDPWSRMAQPLCAQSLALAGPERAAAVAGRFEAEIAALAASGGRASELSRHPRLQRLAWHLRDLQWALGRPEEWIPPLRRLLELFPGDRELRENEPALLRRRGRADLAQRLVPTDAKEGRSPDPWALALHAGTQGWQPLVGMERMEAPVALALTLHLLGADAEARRLLAEVAGRAGDSSEAWMAVLLARHLGEPAVAEAAFARWCDQVLGRASPHEVQAQVRVLLQLSGPGSEGLARAAEAVRRTGRNPALVVAMLGQLRSRGAPADPADGDLLARALESGRPVFEQIAWLRCHPPGERPGLAIRILDRAQDLYPHTLLNLAALVGPEAGPAFEDRLDEALRQVLARTRRSPQDDVSSFLGQLIDVPVPPARALRLAEVALQGVPGHPLGAAVRAILQARAQDAAGAATLAERAVSDLLGMPAEDPWARRLLRGIEAEPNIAAARSRVLWERWRTGRRDPILLDLLLGEVLAEGRLAEAREIAESLPLDGREGVEARMRVAEATGDRAALAALAAARADLAGRSERGPRQALARILATNGRPVSALEVLRGAADGDARLELALLRELGDSTDLERACTRLLVAARTPFGGYEFGPLPVLAPPIGLEGAASQGGSEPAQSLAEDLACTPEGLEILARFQRARLGLGDSSGDVVGKVLARARWRADRPTWTAALEAAVARGEAPPLERSLLRAAAADLAEPGSSSSLGRSLVRVLVAEAQGDPEDLALAQSLAAQAGDSALAEALSAWRLVASAGSEAWFEAFEQDLKLRPEGSRRLRASELLRESAGHAAWDDPPSLFRLARLSLDASEHELASHFRERAWARLQELADGTVASPGQAAAFADAVRSGALDLARRALRDFRGPGGPLRLPSLLAQLREPLPGEVARSAAELILESPAPLGRGDRAGLARWLGLQGLAKEGLRILEGAGAPATASERHLHVDLLRAAGREPEALAAEVAMLEEGVLHPSRLGRVFAHVQSERGGEVGGLARAIATWSDHPPVLAAAVRAAATAGESEEARSLLGRLERRAPAFAGLAELRARLGASPGPP
jgi:Ca-activated chloride channel family protein